MKEKELKEYAFKHGANPHQTSIFITLCKIVKRDKCPAWLHEIAEVSNRSHSMITVRMREMINMGLAERTSKARYMPVLPIEQGE